MLHALYGKDTFASRKALQKALQNLGEDVSLLRYDELSLTKELLQDSLGAQGLFGGKTVVVLDSVLENPGVEDDVLDSLKGMRDSVNEFYLLAGDVLAKTEKDFLKHATKVSKQEPAEGKKKEEYNVFQLADAFLRRDKKMAWVLFTKARMKDMGAQEICGTLMWQMRMLVLAYTTANVAEAGVSDFPYRKAKSGMRFFSESEARNVLARLLAMYHFDPKENRGDLSLALERLILSL